MKQRVTSARQLTSALLERLVEVEFVDRSVALASQAFVAMLPLLVVAAALLPRSDRRSMPDTLADRFDLDATSAAIVERVFAEPAEVRDTLSVIGVLLLVVSALSFCRALQRMYERVWRFPSLGVRATPSQLSWLGLVVIYVAIVGALNTAVAEWLGEGGRLAVGLAGGFFLWLWTPYLLLAGRVERARLRVTAALTALGMAGLGAASLVYMPRSIASSAERFGSIGVAISLVSWLVAAGFVLVFTSSLGAVLAEPRESASPTSPSGS